MNYPCMGYPKMEYTTEVKVSCDLGLVHASYSLPEWQAVKTNFLCTLCIPVLYINCFILCKIFILGGQYNVVLLERLCSKEN